jgi:O-antigen/teichoic acid export membrane protein
VTNLSDTSAVGPKAILARIGIVLDAHRALLLNAGSLFGSTILTAGIGAVYWALAARVFQPNAVGLGAAAISSMQLIAQLSTFGLGTVLMGELAAHHPSQRSLIGSALVVTMAIGAALATVFATVAGLILPQLSDLRGALGVALFAVGVAVTAAGLVLDQALLGLLRGGMQLLRNGIASVTKLIALIVIALAILDRSNGLALLLTWVIGGAVSMLVLATLRRGNPGASSRPIWRAIDGVAALAIRHHALNLAILAPGLLLPLVITAVLSTEANAYFYIAYLIASFAAAIPAAFATAVYAAGARDVDSLAARVRLAIGICAGVGVAWNLFLFVAAEPVLSIFGPAYASHAILLLRLFGLGLFAITINSLFVPITRVERRFLRGTVLMVLSMLIEFVVVVVGARLGGLDGAGVGWLVGYSLSVLPFVPTIYRVAVRGDVRLRGDPPRGNGAPPASSSRVRRLLAGDSPWIRQDDWSIGLVDRSVERVLRWGDPAAGEEARSEAVMPRWLPHRAGTYAADPFGLVRGSETHVFFEEFDQRRQRGRIAHLAVAADGSTSDPQPILEPGCHVSYPFLLEVAGEVWMIPETADLNEVRLYRALDFPGRWRLESVLLAGVPVSDPTVIERDGRWWLFGTSRGRGVNEALRLWHAPSLTGPWALHSNDPVKVDVRSSRPAGTPFLVDDVLYRPSQDCSTRYGGQVVVNRVDLLTPDLYHERVVAHVAPFGAAGQPDGVHTINPVGGRTLVDGNCRHLMPDAMLGLLRARLTTATSASARARSSGQAAGERG